MFSPLLSSPVFFHFFFLLLFKFIPDPFFLVAHSFLNRASELVFRERLLRRLFLSYTDTEVPDGGAATTHNSAAAQLQLATRPCYRMWPSAFSLSFLLAHDDSSFPISPRSDAAPAPAHVPYGVNSHRYLSVHADAQSKHFRALFHRSSRPTPQEMTVLLQKHRLSPTAFHRLLADARLTPACITAREAENLFHTATVQTGCCHADQMSTQVMDYLTFLDALVILVPSA